MYPGGKDEYGYPHFQKQEFALSDGINFNIFTQRDHCHARVVFISA